MDCCILIVQATNAASMPHVHMYAAFTRLMLTQVHTITTAQIRLQQDRDRLMRCFMMESVIPI